MLQVLQGGVNHAYNSLFTHLKGSKDDELSCGSSHCRYLNSR